MSILSINKVLVIDRSARFRRLLTRFFHKNFPNAEIAEYDPKKGCPDNTFPWHDFDLVFLNFEIGASGNGLDWLKICKTGLKFPATILTTDHGDEEIAVRAFRSGVHDYLTKNGLSSSALKHSIHRAMNKHVEENIMDNLQLLQGKLINRVKLFQELDEVYGNGALLLISIDNFSDIHDTIGLIPADDLTSHLADIIVKSSASLEDGIVEIIRISDDTIAVIARGTDNEKIYTKYAEKLCKMVPSSSFKHEGKSIEFKISIGIAFIKDNSHGAKTNVAYADAAVRLAMENPDNSFVVFGGHIQSANISDQKLVLHVQNSIEENRVQPFFQPIISVSAAAESMDTTIYQLRTKLVDLNGQLLGYEEFFPLLKQNKLVKKLDYWVIRYVIDRLNKIKSEDQNKNTGFLITLDEDSLKDKGIIKWIDKIIDFLKQPRLASSIIFEIRSEHFITNINNVAEIMMGLRDKYEISFALTNVQGLSILNTCTHQASFEFIKILMYEKTDSGEKAVDTNELRQLIDGAKALGSLTIAGKIDNADYLSNAIECGTDFVSGYLVHPPQEDISSEDEVVM